MTAMIPMKAMRNKHPRKAKAAGERDLSPAVPLTPGQQRFMLALQRRLEANPDIGPTFEDLRRDLGLSSKASIARLVDGCERRGRIKRLPNRNRALQVIMPVSEEELRHVRQDNGSLIESFNDRELMAEVQKRGLLKFAV